MWLLSITLIAFLILGCSKDPHAATTSVTTNGLTGTLLLDGSIPAVGARVSVYDRSGSQILGKAVTDSKGGFEVSLPDSELVHLEAFSENGSARLWAYNIRNHSASLVLGVPARIYSKSPGFLLGTPYDLVATGDAYSALVPPGRFTFAQGSRTQSQTQGSIELKPSAVDTLKPDLDSGLLFEDFDDGDPYPAVFPLSGFNRWYTSIEGGGTLLNPKNNTEIPMALETDGAWQGKSFHVRFNLNEGRNVQVGCWLGDGELDLTGFEGFRMRMKGDATILVALERGKVDSVGNYFKTAWRFFLDSTWTSYKLDSSNSLELTNYPYFVPLQSIVSTAGILTIFAESGSEFWVDDIRMDGIYSESLLMD